MTPFKQDQSEIEQLIGSNVIIQLDSDETISGFLESTIKSPLDGIPPGYYHSVLRVAKSKGDSYNIDWSKVTSIKALVNKSVKN